MLVKFTSSTSGQIMMFSPVARQLLETIGKDCSARGVITSEELPDAIQKLRLVTDGATRGQSTTALNPDSETADDESAEGPRIGIGQRAYPLIELMDWTRKEEGFILWEAAQDF